MESFARQLWAAATWSHLTRKAGKASGLSSVKPETYHCELVCSFIRVKNRPLGNFLLTSEAKARCEIHGPGHDPVGGLPKGLGTQDRERLSEQPPWSL